MNVKTNNMKTPEEILDDHCTTTYNKYSGDEEIISSKEAVLIAMEEYGKQQYDQAIKDAAENAKVRKTVRTEYPHESHPYIPVHKEEVVVDKDSILKLLKQ